MSKFLFVPFGVGFGHATRVHSIINKMKKSDKIKVASYGNAYNYFRLRGFETEKISGMKISYRSFNFELSSTLLNALSYPFTFYKDYGYLSKIIENFKPDVIISDSEPSSFITAGIKNIKRVMVMNILNVLHEKKYFRKEELKKFSRQIYVLKQIEKNVIKRADRLIIPSLYKYKTDEKINLVPPIIRENILNLPSPKKLIEKLKPKNNFYLVSLGGSDMTRESYSSFLRILSEFKDINFVLSSNYCTRKRINFKNITIFPLIKNFTEYLKICEGIICTAGFSTISEALAFKKPMFLIPVNNHVEQFANAVSVRRLNFGEFYSGNFKGSSLKKELSNFFEIKDSFDKFKSKLNGAEKSAEIIYSLV